MSLGLRNVIGKLEELTLLATIRAGEAALPSAIYDRMVEAVSGGQLAGFGAVYTTLDRMAKKGLLKEGKTQDEQGRSRRTFTITGAGDAALRGNLAPTCLLGGMAYGS